MNHLLLFFLTITQLSFAGRMNLAPRLAADDHELLGVLTYPGGFQEKLSVKLPVSQLVKSFKLSIPSFCSKVDVLEAGVLAEGHQLVAEPLDPKKSLFSVNDGAGYIISGIWVTLNGPPTPNCQIPIYNKTSIVPPPSEFEGTYRQPNLNFYIQFADMSVIDHNIGRTHSAEPHLNFPVHFTQPILQPIAVGKYQTKAYSDIRIRNLNGFYVTCREYATVNFLNTPESPNQIMMEYIAPATISVDSSNRCWIGAQKLDQLTLYRY